MTPYQRLTDDDRAALSAQYAEENARRAQLEAEIHATNRAQVDAIAAAIGGTVYDSPERDEPTYYYTIRLTDDDDQHGPRINLSYERHEHPDKRRIEISGGWPADPEDTTGHPRHRKQLWPQNVGVIDYGDHPPKITAAASRPAASIARDIERKLLPEYRRIYALVEGHAAARLARQTAQDATRARLLAIEPSAYQSAYKPNDIHTNNPSRRYWSAEVSGAQVYALTLKELTADDAERLIRLFLTTERPNQP